MSRSQNENPTYVADEGFYTVQGWMITKLGLKGSEVIIFAIIHNYTLASGYFGGSAQYLGDWATVSRQSVMRALKVLSDKGLITKSKNENVPGTSVKYIANLELCKKLREGVTNLDTYEKNQNVTPLSKNDTPLSKNLTLDVQNDTVECQETLHNKYSNIYSYIYNYNNKYNKNSHCSRSHKENSIYSTDGKEFCDSKVESGSVKMNDDNNGRDNSQDNGQDIPLYNQAVKEVMDFYSVNFGALPGKAIADEIASWLKSVDTDMIKFAIEQATLSGARNWRYVHRVIQEKFGRGITKGSQARIEEESFRRRKRTDTQKEPKMRCLNDS